MYRNFFCNLLCFKDKRLYLSVLDAHAALSEKEKKKG